MHLSIHCRRQLALTDSWWKSGSPRGRQCSLSYQCSLSCPWNMTKHYSVYVKCKLRPKGNTSSFLTAYIKECLLLSWRVEQVLAINLPSGHNVTWNNIVYCYQTGIFTYSNATHYNCIKHTNTPMWKTMKIEYYRKGENQGTYSLTSHERSWLQKGQLKVTSIFSMIFLFGGGLAAFFLRPISVASDGVHS